MAGFDPYAAGYQPVPGTKLGGFPHWMQGGLPWQVEPRERDQNLAGVRSPAGERTTWTLYWQAA